MNFELIFIEFFNIFCPFESIEWQIFESNRTNSNLTPPLSCSISDFKVLIFRIIEIKMYRFLTTIFKDLQMCKRKSVYLQFCAFENCKSISRRQAGGEQ